MNGHAKNISISSLAATLTVATAAWFLLKPALIKDIKADVTEDVINDTEQKITRALAPVNTALSYFVQNNIDTLEDDIGALEFVRDHSEDEWTAEHAAELVKKNQRLNRAKATLTPLEDTP